MSYAIANLIYGIPYTDELDELFDELDLDLEDLGFETFYSGRAQRTVGYLGRHIKKFNEGSDISFGEIIEGINEAENTGIFNKKLDELPEKHRDRIKGVMENPGLWIVWSTS